jgi:hypothetical protein
VSDKGITSDRSEIGVTWRFWVRSAFKPQHHDLLISEVAIKYRHCYWWTPHTILPIHLVAQ